MRLIDADELIKILDEYENNEGSQAIYGATTLRLILGDCKIEIEKLPTAYDVDKVVEEIEKKRDECTCRYKEASSVPRGFGLSRKEERSLAEIDAYSNAIEIIKSCGIKNNE